MARSFFDTSTQLAAGAAFISGTAGNGGVAGIGEGAGTIRDAGSWPDANRFGAIAHSDQAGTFDIEGSFDAVNGPWRRVGRVALVAGTPVDLDVPIRFRYHRIRFVNDGASATGAGAFSIHSSFRSGQ